MSNKSKVGIILAAIFGFFIVVIIVSGLLICCFCMVYVDHKVDDYRTSELSITLKSRRKKGFAKSTKQIVSSSSKLSFQDLESQTANEAFPNVKEMTAEIDESDLQIEKPRKETVSDGDIIVDISKDETTTMSDYISAAGTFDFRPRGLFKSFESEKRLERYGEGESSFNSMTNFDRSENISPTPSQNEQSNVYDQYDSFSRTLMLQKLIETSGNKDSPAIREVSDPFSESIISTGCIVVVVKPFHGTEENEFGMLQPGDLLRVVKFYIKENHKKTNPMYGISKSETRSTDTFESFDDKNLKDKRLKGQKENISETSLLNKLDSSYKSVYCTGIVLNTYLDYNSATSNLSLRLKGTSSISDENEILRDFPLQVVSLETTVLRTMADSPDTLNTSGFEKYSR